MRPFSKTQSSERGVGAESASKPATQQGLYMSSVPAHLLLHIPTQKRISTLCAAHVSPTRPPTVLPDPATQIISTLLCPPLCAADVNMESYETTTLQFDPFPPTGVRIFPNKTSKPNTTPVDTFTPLVRGPRRGEKGAPWAVPSPCGFLLL